MKIRLSSVEPSPAMEILMDPTSEMKILIPWLGHVLGMKILTMKKA
jgi:hypothetical protein